MCVGYTLVLVLLMSVVLWVGRIYPGVGVSDVSSFIGG